MFYGDETNDAHDHDWQPLIKISISNTS